MEGLAELIQNQKRKNQQNVDKSSLTRVQKKTKISEIVKTTSCSNEKTNGVDNYVSLKKRTEEKRPLPSKSEMMVSPDVTENIIQSSKVTDETPKFNNFRLDIGEVAAMSDEKLVYNFMRTVILQWDHIIMSGDNNITKTEVNSLKEAKEHLRPLFKKLKKKKLERTIVHHLKQIITHLLSKDYVKATDWYVKLAIGNASWPIGVTATGIHERSARTRIEESKVAHIMNNEEQRRYLTSFKRLMTFCQRTYPTKPSKSVT